MWRTSDGGRTWRASAEPRTLGYTTLAPFSMALTDRGLAVRTAAGPAVSRDGGRTWTLARPPSRVEIEGLERRHRFRSPARIRLTNGRWYRTAWCTNVWRPTERNIWLQCATANVHSRGVVLAKSDNGGRSWRLFRTRAMYISEIAVVGAREAWAYSEPYSIEDYVKRGVPTRLWHTTDGGATWHRVWIALPTPTRVAWVTSG